MIRSAGPDKPPSFLLLLLGIAATFVITVVSGTPLLDRSLPKQFTSLETRLGN